MLLKLDWQRIFRSIVSVVFIALYGFQLAKIKQMEILTVNVFRFRSTGKKRIPST